MPNKTYRLEPQRRGEHGYEPCLPHAAIRFAIIETTRVPARLGRRKYHHERMLEYFSGPKAHDRASQRLARLTHNNNSSKKRALSAKGEPYARSCTRDEYDEIMNRQSADNWKGIY